MQLKELVLLDHFTQIQPNIFNRLPQIDAVTKIKSILIMKDK